MMREISRTNKHTVSGLLFIIYYFLFSMTITSCADDLLEVDSTRDLFDKELTQKTDSIFMAYGIMQSMQQLADQYVVTGEMRGDLTATTYYTDEHLRQLADFSATTANRYDSAYVYYAVINNCNYYIAHRDTTLYTGAINVTTNEFIAVKAFRAWAYLMLARNYGKVPFFMQPLTQISDINGGNYPELGLNDIVSRLADDLEQDLARYGGYVPVPDYGAIACGTTNFGQSKTAQSRLCFIPADVILGEMYLEAGQYDRAARHYTTYLIHNRIQTGNRWAAVSTAWIEDGLPTDFYNTSRSSANQWEASFGNNATADIITYIPMSVNRLRGTITRIPQLFGYRYYSTSSSADSLYTDEIQIVPSESYHLVADSADYYYATDQLGTTINSAKLGDMRRPATLQVRSEVESMRDALLQMRKYNNANIVLYRETTVYLHLAEALNRLGHPDLAFAILKDGIDRQLLTANYLTDASKTLLQTTYPFLSSENISIFDPAAGSLAAKSAYGIHKHGCGYTNGALSPYQYDAVIGKKLAEQQISTPTLQDSINAMEDLLCDEYAMEFAFEGNRFADLCRMARHKNDAAASSGSKWLVDKLAYKSPKKDLTDERNWYLPLK
jgi:hypothetical protein